MGCHAVSEARRAQIVATARRLLEEGGEEAVTMRRLALEIGIQAPSLYKHFADRSAILLAVKGQALAEMGDALAAARGDIAAMARAYRAWALAHPHLYDAATRGPLDRERLPADLEARAERPLRQVVPGQDLARAVWASAHGLAILELTGRFPPGADIDAAWSEMVAAYRAAATGR